MNWFKRLCLFVFGVCGILALAALSLVWVGPWTTQARTLITENRWYFLALEVMVCILAVGLLYCVLKALFTPRNPKESVVVELDGGKIIVTRQAVVSQVKNIVEADGTCTTAQVHVKMRKRGNVRVHARLRPRGPIDVTKQGQILHEELEQGLAKICGESVRSISLVFMQAEEGGDLASYVDDATPAVAEQPEAQNEIRVTPSSQLTLRLENKDVSMYHEAERSYPAAPSASGTDDAPLEVSAPQPQPASDDTASLEPAPEGQPPSDDKASLEPAPEGQPASDDTASLDSTAEEV